MVINTINFTKNYLEKPMGNVTFHRRLGAILYDGLLVLSLMFFGTYIFVAALGKEIEAGSFWYQLTLLLFAHFFFRGVLVYLRENLRNAIMGFKTRKSK